MTILGLGIGAAVFVAALICFVTLGIILTHEPWAAVIMAGILLYFYAFGVRPLVKAMRLNLRRDREEARARYEAAFGKPSPPPIRRTDRQWLTKDSLSD